MSQGRELNKAELLAVLDWYRAAGVDLAVGEDPVDRFAQPAPTPSPAQALRQGKTDQAVIELEYAAEQGVPGAIWKLGRMYADGEGVKMN